MTVQHSMLISLVMMMVSMDGEQMTKVRSAMCSWVRVREGPVVELGSDLTSVGFHSMIFAVRSSALHLKLNKGFVGIF